MTRFSTLLQGFINDRLTEEELKEFLQLLEKNDHELEERVLEDLRLNATSGLTSPELREAMYQNVLHRSRQPIIRRLWPRVAVAAAVLIVASLAIIGIITKNHKTYSPTPVAETLKKDIAPGREGAILTLADGRQIVLDSTTGTIANEAGVSVVNKDGSVSYEKPSTFNLQPLTVYNTMSTPKGRQYSLVLADGSKVWLNAASSIRYPTAFAGNERRVEITGEAYFEIAHNASKPFIVQKGQTEVKVLGTHFNVNAYDDEESLKVTLLEGSVAVSSLTANSQLKAKLKPGQQAILTHNSQLETRNNIDVDEVMSWKNGFFSFSNADIRTVMRQLSRWYDVDVVYQGEIPNEKLEGKIPRNVNASAVLGALQYTGIKFEIEGKKIIVMK
jgi:ferric-dicitrate binding protein FerR (iron transport regulator)